MNACISFFDPGTFLSNLLVEVDAGRLSTAEMEQGVLEMLIAGTDTSSVTLGWVWAMLRPPPPYVVQGNARKSRPSCLATGSGAPGWAPDWSRYHACMPLVTHFDARGFHSTALSSSSSSYVLPHARYLLVHLVNITIMHAYQLYRCSSMHATQ